MSIATICLSDLDEELRNKMVGEQCFTNRGCPLGEIKAITGDILTLEKPPYGHGTIVEINKVYFMPYSVERIAKDM